LHRSDSSKLVDIEGVYYVSILVFIQVDVLKLNVDRLFWVLLLFCSSSYDHRGFKLLYMDIHK